MPIENYSSNKEKIIEAIECKRSFIEDEVDRIIKKSYSMKINPEKKKQTLDFLFQNLPFFLNSININMDFEQIETLELKSKNDLELAKKAYEMEDYGNALFHLQQSIEKSTKAYGLFLGIIKNPQKEISHKTPKVFIKLLQLSWVDDLAKIYDCDYNIQKNIANLEFLVKDENKSSIIDLDTNIPLFLNLYKTTLINTKKVFSKREIKKIIGYMKNHYGVDIKSIYMIQIEFAYFLYLFSFVTWIYAVDPRYSNEIEYSKLNIIKSFNKIVKLLDDK